MVVGSTILVASTSFVLAFVLPGWSGLLAGRAVLKLVAATAHIAARHGTSPRDSRMAEPGTDVDPQGRSEA